MQIRRTEIENFRSLKHLDIDCRGSSGHDDHALLAILGRNGGGKSSILYALDVFYDVGARMSIEDFYDHDPTNAITIRITYGDLRPEESKEFQSYIENDQLIVTKRITMGDNGCVPKYFAAAKQIREFAECRQISSDIRPKYKELAALPKFAGLPPTAKSRAVAEENMASFEASHPDMLETVERQEQFFGPKEVGGGKLDKYTKFVLVPAVRDAGDEGQKKGVISELINTIVLRQVNKRPDVKQLRAEMKEKIEKTFSQENLTELGGLGSAITQLLEQYSPGSALILSWGAPEIPMIPLPKPNVDLVEDDFPCPISHTGHGLQRSLILTLLQYLAIVERPAEENERTDEDPTTPKPESQSRLQHSKPDASPVVVNPDLILAIEEPELYLHPSRCRYLSELLLKLARKSSEASSPRNQIIYVTHSPYFVDLHRFDHVRIARKIKMKGNSAPFCVLSQYSLQEAASELARIAEGDPKKFTRDSFRARSLPVMTLAVNEGFFAHAVAVVEGLSDIGVLWTIQAHLGLRWAQLGIAAVPAVGKNNLDRPVVVFRGLKIPTYLIFDGDSSHKGGNQNRENDSRKRNALYQRLAGAEEPADFPQTQVHDTWAVVEDDFEAELKKAAGSDFNSIAQKAVDELGYSGSSDLMKNTEGAARLVELMYQGGKRIPALEEIVRRVTALCDPSLAKPSEPIQEVKLDGTLIAHELTKIKLA